MFYGFGGQRIVGVTGNRTTAIRHVKTMVYNNVTTIEGGVSVPSQTAGGDIGNVDKKRLRSGIRKSDSVCSQESNEKV
jgi:hypothetical protein